jgi:hypothetical protein
LKKVKMNSQKENMTSSMFEEENVDKIPAGAEGDEGSYIST